MSTARLSVEPILAGKALELAFPAVTDGKIAAINLESARRRAWVRFAQCPRIAGIAEAVVNAERMTAQFLGDLDALDRMEKLAAQFARVDDTCSAELVNAEVAAALHRFEEAQVHLGRARLLGAPRQDLKRHSLTIDQACGVRLDVVEAERRRIAAASGRLEDLVPLGSVLADLDRFAEADAVYRDALDSYDGMSPFLPAWACFQLGMLWGELVPVPDLARGQQWYWRAIEYLSGYVKARVHLAETLTATGQYADAERILEPTLSSNDPEVRWRLAEVMLAGQRFAEAGKQLDAARFRFDELLRRHELAFADHGAEFYATRGNDRRRALELARVNVANRPTRRAISQASAIACRHLGKAS